MKNEMLGGQEVGKLGSTEGERVRVTWNLEIERRKSEMIKPNADRIGDESGGCRLEVGGKSANRIMG